MARTGKTVRAQWEKALLKRKEVDSRKYKERAYICSVDGVGVLSFTLEGEGFTSDIRRIECMCDTVYPRRNITLIKLSHTKVRHHPKESK